MGMTWRDVAMLLIGVTLTFIFSTIAAYLLGIT